MDFLTAVRLLMALRKACPGIRYHFEGDVLHVNYEVWCLDGTPEKFQQAAKMFEPV